MPSPFPGMDLYLEHSGLWPDVHHRTISIASDQLGARLRPKYFVRIEERVYVTDALGDEEIVRAPDLRIAEQPGWAGGLSSRAGWPSRSTWPSRSWSRR